MSNIIKLDKLGKYNCGFLNKKVHVTNCAFDPVCNKIVTSVRNNCLPLYTNKLTCDQIESAPLYYQNFASINVKYVNTICDKLVVVPDCKFEVLYTNLKMSPNCTYSKLTFADCEDIQTKIVSCIISNTKTCSICNDATGCFDLVGVTSHYKISNGKMASFVNFLVQTICPHNPGNKLLFIIAVSINLETMILGNELTLLGEYNLYRAARSVGIKKKYASKLIATGYSMSNDNSGSSDIYILVSYGEGGYLINLKYHNLIQMLDSLLNFKSIEICGESKCQLHLKPRGITFIGKDRLFVICDKVDNYINYYILSK